MPKYFDVVHGSREWELCRVGIPTSSEFERILTPTGKRSTQADAYADRLIAEILTGEAHIGVNTPYMERGSIMELDAANAYELLTGSNLARGGFVTDDLGRYGASPDRLVDDEGLLEIKCPAANTHVGYLLADTVHKDYFPQLQGQLFVTERKWVDIFSFHPVLPPAKIRVVRDEPYIEKLSLVLDEFRTMMSRKIEILVEKGHYKLPEKTTEDLWGAG